jgi:hypothetical protein
MNEIHFPSIGKLSASMQAAGRIYLNFRFEYDNRKRPAEDCLSVVKWCTSNMRALPVIAPIRKKPLKQTIPAHVAGIAISSH